MTDRSFWRDLVVGGSIIVVLSLTTSFIVRVLQQSYLDELGETATASVRVRYYPVIPAGDCELWDRIRYECEDQ